MRLEGSCQCRAVRFGVQSGTPVPYQRCYCGICRKTQGGGGFAINLAADARTLEIEGEENITRYHAHVRNPGQRERISGAERAFCRHCGSALFLFDPDYPELIHPFASAIDTALPVPPAHVHMMLAFKPDWVELVQRRGDERHDTYPETSIADWHDQHGVTQD